MRLSATSLLLTGLLSCSCAAPRPRDPAAAGPLACVQDLYDAMARHDRVAAETLLVPGTVFVGTQESEARVEAGVTPAEAWLQAIAGATGTMREEFAGRPEVRVAGNVAMVWGPYRFLWDGEVHHVGINAFSLLRVDGTWKISGVTYSAIR